MKELVFYNVALHFALYDAIKVDIYCIVIYLSSCFYGSISTVDIWTFNVVIDKEIVVNALILEICLHIICPCSVSAFFSLEDI